jgi:hypothetical protein
MNFSEDEARSAVLSAGTGGAVSWSRRCWGDTSSRRRIASRTCPRERRTPASTATFSGRSAQNRRSQPHACSSIP